LNSAECFLRFAFFVVIQRTLYNRDNLPAGCPLNRCQLI
jgi:hypothetical protein